MWCCYRCGRKPAKGRFALIYHPGRGWKLGCVHVLAEGQRHQLIPAEVSWQLVAAFARVQDWWEAVKRSKPVSRRRRALGSRADRAAYARAYYRQNREKLRAYHREYGRRYKREAG